MNSMIFGSEFSPKVGFLLNAMYEIIMISLLLYLKLRLYCIDFLIILDYFLPCFKNIQWHISHLIL